MVSMPRALAARDAELADLRARLGRANRDREMLQRQNEELLTTDIGELACRVQELTAQLEAERQAHALELQDLRSRLAAERERWVK